ncbi:MAG: NAD-dependent epimerase [Candidatus Xenobia bacterium]
MPGPETILLTGSAGFIGSHAATKLLKAGKRVIGIDNLNDYYSPTRKSRNLQEIQQENSSPEHFQFVEGDIRDSGLLQRLFQEHQIDKVVHLAGMAGVRNSIEDPALYIDINLKGTLNLLDKARDYQVKNFVFSSTSSVYGNTQVTPFNESDPCDRPLAPYPATKRAAELLAHSYHHLYGLNFTSLRFFTVYGPRGRPDMMAYRVLDNIFFGRETPLYNQGEMFRDWTYVEDIVSGVIAATERQLGYALINLGRGQPLKLSDFVRIVEEKTGRKAKLTPERMMEADIPYTFADITRAGELLGYQPRVDVEEGIERFWQWYRKAVLEKDQSLEALRPASLALSPDTACLES